MTQQHDQTGTRIGMWLFLYTEIILFGGLFVLYAVYLYQYWEDFVRSGKELDRVLGTINTSILIVSSWLVACSITAFRTGRKYLCLGMLAAAFSCGLGFLVIKYLEWGHKFAHGIYPGSEQLASGPHGRTIFFGLYYVITGLHGIHVIIGMTLLAICFALVVRGRIATDRYVLLDNAGLYWHLVDLLWIFIFPLFYLII